MASDQLYPPLPQSDSIRILVLRPAQSADEELSGELIATCLKDEPFYQAVSYCWMAEAKPDRLELAGGHINITRNLCLALRRFRDKDRARRFWIDAVCINQGNKDEKGSQVRLMAEIFKKAERVLGWLGPENEEAKITIQHFKQLANSCTRFGVSRSESLLLVSDNPTLDGDARLENAREIINTAQQFGFFQIYENAWFSRLWVVEEVVVSRQTIMYSDSDELEWVDFATVLRMHLAAMNTAGETKDRGRLTLAGQIVQARAKQLLNSPRGMYYDYAYNEFGWTLKDFREHKCSDERDRVYALMGFCPSDIGIAVPRSYTLTAEEVYISLAIQFAKLNDLGFLYDAGTFHRKETDWDLYTHRFNDQSYLPSWVPEQRIDKRFERDSFIEWKGYPRTFATGSAHQAHVLVDEATHQRIAVSGRFFNSVATIVRYEDFEKVNVFAATAMFLFCKDISQGTEFKESLEPGALSWADQDRPNSTDRFEDFTRTIVLDGAALKKDKFFKPDMHVSSMELWRNWEVQVTTPDGECFKSATEVHGDWKDRYPRMGEKGRQAFDYWTAILEVVRLHDFMLTDQGLLGLVPKGTEVGDRIVIIDGCPTPFVIRSVPDTNDHLVVGSCYVHGIMYGEIVGGEHEFLNLI